MPEQCHQRVGLSPQARSKFLIQISILLLPFATLNVQASWLLYWCGGGALLVHAMLPIWTKVYGWYCCGEVLVGIWKQGWNTESERISMLDRCERIECWPEVDPQSHAQPAFSLRVHLHENSILSHIQKEICNGICWLRDTLAQSQMNGILVIQFFDGIVALSIEDSDKMLKHGLPNAKLKLMK